MGERCGPSIQKSSRGWEAAPRSQVSPSPVCLQVSIGCGRQPFPCGRCGGGERFSDTWSFSERKTELLEGGLRIPAIVCWQGVTCASTASALCSRQPEHHADTLVLKAEKSLQPSNRGSPTSRSSGSARSGVASLDGHWGAMELALKSFADLLPVVCPALFLPSGSAPADMPRLQSLVGSPSEVAISSSGRLRYETLTGQSRINLPPADEQIALRTAPNAPAKGNMTCVSSALLASF